MNEDHKSISQHSKKFHDESQSVSDNAKIGESAEAMEQARQALIKLRMRRRKRTVVIKWSIHRFPSELRPGRAVCLPCLLHDGEESSAPKQFSDYWICGDVKSWANVLRRRREDAVSWLGHEAKSVRWSKKPDMNYPRHFGECLAGCPYCRLKTTTVVASILLSLGGCLNDSPQVGLKGI